MPDTCRKTRINKPFNAIKIPLTSHTDAVKNPPCLFPFSHIPDKIETVNDNDLRQELQRQQNKEAFKMVIGIWAIMILYALIGGISTLVLVVSIPAILVWKGYRRIKYRIPFTC